ncbi:MAG: ABC transporter ATP-binding protein [Clostridia bacterium]
MNNECIIRFENLTKRFGDNIANNQITLDIYKGQIHAILGENGSGKSTLMKILYGLYQPTEGNIYVHGKKILFTSSKQAIANGICMIHQHFMLVPQMTVLENIISGDLRNKIIINRKELTAKILEISDMYGLKIEPEKYIYQLSVGEQQRVEIIKALYRGAEIMILDEPTSVLTKQETYELLRVLRMLVDNGKTVIFITHKLEEVLEFADVCTIFRAGNLIKTVLTSEVDKVSLSRMMVGRDVVFRVQKDDVVLGKPALCVHNVTFKNKYGRQVVNDVSLEIRAGEVVGIAGVDGNGQTELSELICGMEKTTSGTVELCGKNITKTSVASRIRGGLSFVPAERNGVGAIGELSIVDNVILRDYNQKPFCKGILLNNVVARELTEELHKKFNIKLASIDMPGGLLSGGNLQKVILARELNRNPKAIVCVQPTRGLDVGATENIHRSILETRKYGTGVLLISTELEEILSLSDRIAVMFEGRIMGILKNDESLNMDHLGMMMAGSNPFGGNENDKYEKS